MSSRYPVAPLADLASDVSYGYTASASPELIGPKFLRITDIVPERLDWTTVPYCAISDRDRKKYRLESGDIVIARTGATVGYSKCLDDPPDAVYASYLIRVRIAREHDTRFVGHVVGSADYKKFVLANAGGAAQPNANAKVLTSYPVPLPTLPTQRKIAAVLSAYDDLIENNTRRIEILEEMAQRIYREWFVEFRYPGHEGVPLVDSELGPIPEGWELAAVKDVIKRVPAGNLLDSKSVSQSGMIPVLDQGRSGVIGYHDGTPGVHATTDSPVLVFANHTCYQRLVHFPFSAIQNVLPFVPYPEHSRDIYWLHWATKDLVRFNDYKGHWPEFVSKGLVLPPPSLCSEFGDIARPLAVLWWNLESQSANLRATRDLLLPRLISGEINVEDLNIDTSDLAA